MWFERLMGFAEVSPSQVRDRASVSGDVLTSSVNGRSFGCGRLETPTLGMLRERRSLREGSLSVREIVGEAGALHGVPTHAGALLQAASQFNLLEMTGPSVTPEAGVGIYEHDRTQGPACAIACGAGTIYRNYFAPVMGGLGQTHDRQIDCLLDVGAALGNTNARLWSMSNGYALLTEEGLTDLGPRLRGLHESQLDELRSHLRVGLHHDVEVTLSESGQRVTQVYGSALPVAYGRGAASDWEALARLLLEASYEATLIAGAMNAERTGNERVLLTLLGGGVFGNHPDWIFAAIDRALRLPGLGGLDVAIVSYGSSSAAVRRFLTNRATS